MEENRVYLIFDKITPQLRGILSVLLITAGFFFQISAKNIFVGMPFIIPCLILNLIKGIAIKKVTTKSLNWQEVTPEKIDQALQHCQRIKKFQSKDIGCLILLFFVIFAMIFGFPFLEILKLPFPLIVALINAVILFLGIAWSGRKSAWMPPGLDIKSEIVKRMLNAPVIRNDPMLQAVPYLEIAKADKGTLPNDTRLLIKFKDAPDEFIGLQAQISINSVQAKEYPYFYVVLIAKPQFNLLEKFRGKALDKCVIENKKTEEVDVVVIRQQTTKTSGYYTDTAVQDYILSNGIKLAKGLF